MSEAFHPFHCVLIRNVMVGRRGLSREVLLDAFESAGGAEVRSILATGNVVFRAADPDAAAVVERAARQLWEAIGLREPLVLRHLAELRALQAAQPFADAPTDEVHERFVSFFPPGATFELSLPWVSARRDLELLGRSGPQVYGVTRRTSGRSGAPNALLERRTGQRCTTRNWNTVERIIRLCSDPAEPPSAG